jgi:excisionase family DNA binding protein
MIIHNQNNPLFTLTVYEFSELQRSILMEALKRESSKEVPENSAEYLNFTEATKYLGISKPTFSKLRKEGKIPCYRVSENRVIFSKNDLDYYIIDKREN